MTKKLCDLCPRRAAAVAFLVLFASAYLAAQPGENGKTQNIIFVMTDGLRWQEVFRGAEAGLMDKKHGHVANLETLKKAYWRDAEEARRAALMPFLWSVVAKDGQIYGNRDKGSEAYVTNNLNFSYPGYSETFCGFVDPRVRTNDKVPNPNVTVLEWLHGKSSYQGKIAAFAAWDTFPYIFNASRAGFPVNAGYSPLTLLPDDPIITVLNRLKEETPQIWDDEPFDSIPFYTALEYLKQRKPRVLYISLGETDTWAHQGNYAEYLNAAHRADGFLNVLWQTAQSMPEYRNNTTLIFLPDHGRGHGLKGWRDHGERVPSSKYIWMAFLGPDTSRLGERSHVTAVTQNQVAATLAALLGEDYVKDVPQAGKAIDDVVLH